ncbi:MAG: indole-3-glycerol phosphate synthase TrpC [Gemmatimonadetes bacterium]|nr:indole-3-glycerol phosphate synthase TrpC [Gemmatimonadota bacterium]
MPETQGRPPLPGVLASIVHTKREELAALLAEGRDTALERRAEQAPPTRDFVAALSQPSEVSLIAECKRRSPGAGEIRPELDPAALTRSYEANGAAALSVLTDESYFGGSTADLERVRAATSIPVLRKDFTLDPVHVVEARAAGADAILLIVRILDPERLLRLRLEAEALGMAVLVEVHDAEEVSRALDAGARIVGINNRDLATFTTRLETTLELREMVPPNVVVVSESGIRSRDDVARLGAAGVNAVLVGEALLRGDDPGVTASSLVGVSRRGTSGR